MIERKTRKHPVYTIEEKNGIVIRYLINHESIKSLSLSQDVNRTQIRAWIKQYRTHGTTIDNRGRGTKTTGSNKGRPRKAKFDLESMSKSELIEHIRMIEDVKKATACLRLPKKNTK